MTDDFLTAFCDRYILRFSPENWLTKSDLARINEFILSHPKANAPLAIDAVEEASKKEGHYPVSYCLAIADRYYGEILPAQVATEDRPDKWMLAYQKQKARVADLQAVHGFTDHFLKFKCKGDVCKVGQLVPSGAQGELM